MSKENAAFDRALIIVNALLSKIEDRIPTDNEIENAVKDT